MIYFNNAATSYPKPQCVLDAVSFYAAHPPIDAGRSSMVEDEKDVILSCRNKLAKLFGAANSSCISFTSGSTQSINMIVKGLGLDNKHVITTTTEHSSVVRALKVAEKERNVNLSFVPCDEQGFIHVDDIRNQINKDTKAIFVNHSSNVVGTEVDLYAISELAHDENLLLIVDASQSAGTIPINVRELDIDIMAFTGHKSLHGIAGIGGLYVKEDVDIQPLIVGGTGVKSTSLYQIEERPIYFEAGTQNFVGIASLEAGVSYILDKGIDAANVVKSKLYYSLRDKLENIPEIKLYGTDKYYSPIIGMNVNGVDPKEVGNYLSKRHNIVVRTGILCAPLIHHNLGSDPNGLVRISLSSFNTEDEILTFVDAIKEMIDISKTNQEELHLDNSNLSCV
ncbi:aminotransferase class V-fold PLP-dependent enzyme [Anaeromicropila populeti]|uniref:cysteine desulfurase n=1 Tax=Anaeromicropila populeti TaxID=37658 RepID=A0A1I6L153_9FIRM|nr:aminotransferase class V-fold PLP-dependent enzyme [Anaeromicropila populeti]SFR97018.1 cysteine desulfurase family protein [Anaeromicropila populeti]